MFLGERFHAWLVRAPSAHARSDNEFGAKVRASFIHADVSDYIERFYNPTRRHSTSGYLSPMDFERQVLVA